MTPEQSERLVRIEERLMALTEAINKRVEVLETEVTALKKAQTKLLVLAAGVAGGSTALVKALAGIL